VRDDVTDHFSLLALGVPWWLVVRRRPAPRFGVDA
jgi:hypothetical protein